MSVAAGQNLHDINGWVPVTCQEADLTRGINKITPSSSLTDLNGQFGTPVIYTEWSVADTEIPVLRDYLWHPHTAAAMCVHYVVEEGTL